MLDPSTNSNIDAQGREIERLEPETEDFYAGETNVAGHKIGGNELNNIMVENQQEQEGP